MQGTTCNVEYDPDSEGETVFSTITGDNMQTEVFSNQVLFIHKLRVNVKSLAAESRLIREEAYRCGRQYVSYLTEHRRGRLREESRAAQLALAFIRERPYYTVEAVDSKPVSAQRIVSKLQRLGYLCDRDLLGSVESWLRERP